MSDSIPKLKKGMKLFADSAKQGKCFDVHFALMTLRHAEGPFPKRGDLKPG